MCYECELLSPVLVFAGVRFMTILDETTWEAPPLYKPLKEDKEASAEKEVSVSVSDSTSSHVTPFLFFFEAFPSPPFLLEMQR